MARKPKEKRKDFVLRARVTPVIKARTLRVCEERSKDESEWVREALVSYLDSEEKRLGLKAIGTEEISRLTEGKEVPEPARAWPPKEIRVKSHRAPGPVVYAGKTGTTSSLSDDPPRGGKPPTGRTG